jgi:hypothetical protein
MKLTFEKVDQIWAATGRDHYYRTFRIEDGWILYIHPFNDDKIPDRGVPVGTLTFDNAQTFAQAFEDDAEGDDRRRLEVAAEIATRRRVDCGHNNEELTDDRAVRCIDCGKVSL